MSSPESRVWLITGTSSGFGRSLAEAALAAGDRIVATARRPETLDDLVAVDPERVEAVALDVTDRAQIAAAVRTAHGRFGRIDVLVNNAGFGSVGAIEEVDEGELRGVFDTMFFGAVALTQAVLPGLREQGSGAVVNMSSMGGQMSPPGFGAYCSAKFALEAVSESLAAELAPFGIQVLIVEPGAFATSFGGSGMQRSADSGVYAETAGANREAVDGMDGSQPGDPDKAAAAILKAVGAQDAPLRLALGNDAVDALAGALDQRRADLDAWAEVSRSTDAG